MRPRSTVLSIGKSEQEIDRWIAAYHKRIRRIEQREIKRLYRALVKSSREAR